MLYIAWAADQQEKEDWQRPEMNHQRVETTEN